MKPYLMIPCRNEEATIGDLVSHAKRYVRGVLVANDSSTDNTAREAIAAGAVVFDVPRERKGLVGTYTLGLRRLMETFPDGTVYFEMDAGGSHDPSFIPFFLGEIASGADVATGRRFGLSSRYEGHWRRKALSWLGTRVTNAIHGTDFKDATSGYIAYTRQALGSLLSLGPWKSTGHYYQTEMRLRAVRAGLKVVEVPIVYRNSGSSLNWRSIREAVLLAGVGS